MPNLRMNSVLAFVSLILFIYQTHSNTCIAYASYPRNEMDEAALLAFKDKMIEDPRGIMSSWKESVSHCNWSRVSCSRRHTGRVTALDLMNQKLIGTIPPDIGNLTFLRRIDLRANRLRGNIPEEFGRLFRLKRLVLGNNELEGEIPRNLSSCIDMQYLCLNFNRLSGRIPDELRYLVERKLITFVVGWNNLTGGIPNWLGNGSSLVNLELQQNNLKGRIPAELGSISRLELLHIGFNKLIGRIPSSIYNLTSLLSLAVNGNGLHGKIPPEIGNNFPHLQSLYLGQNRFSGQVPHSLPNATRLGDLFLERNSFTGSVPANMGNLMDLTKISFSVNKLQTGLDGLSFHTALTNCTKLKYLDFGYNIFRGEIPASVANFTNLLRILSLAENRITGNIPPEIENLNGLQILALYNNSIDGEIPHGIGKLQNLTYLYLWGNSISGAIPSSLGNVTQLLRLSLQYNQLEGNIPPNLGRCQQLQALALSNNNLNGTIPKEVIGLSSLSLYFGVAGNSLTGPLPLEVGNMSQIVEVELFDNSLTGEIPSTLSQCLMLVNLDMAGNFFEGSIPPSLRTLIGLVYLNLSRNRLSGQIPIYFENFTVLEKLNLSFNSLEGEVPHEGIFRDTKRISIMGNKELCGGIKELGLLTCKVHDIKKRRKLPKLKFFIAVTISFLIVLTCFIVVVYWRRKSRTRPSVALPTEERFQKVSYAKLRHATGDFSPSNLIGQGSHGFVYSGMLDGNRQVAVKVLNLNQKGAFNSFLAECEVLRNIRHRNLVNIITVCSSIDFTGAEFKALVYDLMRNGSLEQWLHPGENQLDVPKLNLRQRLDIAIDAASAIEYLHHHCQMSIVHGDLKPSNVLLDHDMVARVCDFGLARFLRESTNLDASQCQASSSGLKGTIGYVAPEYGLGRTSSLQGDVYSFGILLLEMFIGIRPTDVMFKDGWTLHEFVKTARHKSLVKILDPSLLSMEHPVGIDYGQFSDAGTVRFEENIANIMRIGVLCSAKLPIERMDMTNALSKLCAVREKLFRCGM
ncbi:probable LRR receptor-like serine/threonine-protein kinase At3g47570 [Eucalyptus grandis]|uniref:probable LRR receptor-like serine/threonine-protein kinase At3g47570 n=1 Tax=Eucalyptus grandis TaxID=71139 RepID=UPI00192EA5AA|nr:probable LRR receptor-like serine/threonine-protein kinase At3g47570 [Eucalyptus grandis]